MFACSFSSSLETGEANESNSWRDGQRSNVSQQGARKAKQTDHHFYQGGHDNSTLDLNTQERERDSSVKSYKQIQNISFSALDYKLQLKEFSDTEELSKFFVIKQLIMFKWLIA